LAAFVMAFSLPLVFFLTPPPDVDRIEIRRGDATREG
jgi:hypothetical protein